MAIKPIKKQRKITPLWYYITNNRNKSNRNIIKKLLGQLFLTERHTPNF